MGVNERLTDRERVELTKKSYEHLQLGDNITIGPYDIGTVCRVEHAKDGMSAFVVSSPSEITILFKDLTVLKKVHRRLGVMNGLKRNIPILMGDAITRKDAFRVS